MMYRHGFSLVELSIVLVILGLLTGGILGGQSLIRAAELRAVTTESQRYITAFASFRDKYLALPGDITNATSFWGTDSNCPGNRTNTPVPVNTTCNGNGDGRINGNETTNNASFRAWQHLQLASLIEGQYTGVAYDTVATTWMTSLTSPNIPKSRISQAGWHAMHASVPATYNTITGNVLQLGAPFDAYGNSTPVLKPEETWNIDTKLDDGNPASGSISSSGLHNGTSATHCANQATNSYNLGNNGLYCALIVKL